MTGMRRPRVFVTRHLPGSAEKQLAAFAETEIWPGDLPPSSADLARHATGCHGLLTLLTDRVDEQLLRSVPSLLVVSNMATGFDNVDVLAATMTGVLVARTPGVLSDTTADLAFALILGAGRRVVEADRYVREGKWKTWGPEILLGNDVHGATLGIVGMGGVGTAVARRATGFGMRIVYASRTRKPEAESELGAEFVSLGGLLSVSDFVSLHAPLTDETYKMINAQTLALMKPTAVLVNTGRGGLVDEGALYDALRGGVIGAAAVDVTDPEPMDSGNPLLTLPNFIVTPHIASASVATRSRMALLAVENLAAALRGEIPEHAVNPEARERWRRRVREAGFA